MVPEPFVSLLTTVVLEFAVLAAGFCLTLHLAARYVLGPVRVRRSLAGVAPAAVIVLGGVSGRFALGAVLALAVDFLAIGRAYDLDRRTAGLVTVGHAAVSVILAFALGNLARLAGGPGR